MFLGAGLKLCDFSFLNVGRYEACTDADLYRAGSAEASLGLHTYLLFPDRIKS